MQKYENLILDDFIFFIVLVLCSPSNSF